MSQDLVLNFHSIRTVLRNLFGLRSNGSDFCASPLNLGAGESNNLYAAHSGNLLRLARIDPYNSGVSMGRAHKFRNEHCWQIAIVRVLRAARNLLGPVD